jgi:chromosome segregation ATPase
LRPVEPKPDEPKPPSRLGRFFRKALRWLTGLILVFGLGVGTTWFVRVQPMNNQIEDLKNQLQAAEITVGEMESLIAEYQSLESDKEAVESELLDMQLHVDIMRIVLDVVSAQLALANDDIVTAKASLTGTDTRLADLQERLQGEDQQTIEGMRTRLALVLDEMEEDAFAAMSDLEVLASNLVALERSLFGN